MTKETFQPISVKPPSSNPMLFAFRCFVDLQLGTIVKYLRPAMAGLPAGDIIDIGAGEAPWREWLPAHARYQGLDIQNADDFGMSAKGGDIAFYDGGDMPFADRSFDGAICIEVLEHAADPAKLLSEIARVLKAGAPLLLTVPWSARRHHIPHDYHRFTRERLFQLLTEHGFADVRIEERGDDVAAIANKMIVLTIRTVTTLRLGNVLIAVPAGLLYGAMAGVMLLAAHVSMAWRTGSDEDPLGYFCAAVKRSV